MTLTEAKLKAAQIGGDISALLDKPDRTEAENARLKELTAEGGTLQARLAELKEAHDQAEALKGLTHEAEKKAAAVFGDQDGTVTLGKTEKGETKVLDDSRSGIGAKAWAAISEPSYAKAWGRALRGVADAQDYKVLAEAKGMTEGLDVGGGYLVPADYQDMIVQRKPHPTQILAYVNRATTGRDRLKMPKVNYTTDDIYASGIRIQWTGENGPTAEDTAMDSGWGEVTIPIYTGSFQIEVSRDLLEDSAFDLEGWITKEAGRTYALAMDNEIVNGTGVSRPSGILRNPGGTDEPPTLNIGNPVTAANLLQLTYGLPPQYADNAAYLMNRTSVYAALAQITNSSNDFIFGLDENTAGLARPRRDMLLGFPIAFSAFMPASGAANNVVVHGDFREAYTFVERIAFSIEQFGEGDRTMLRNNRVGYHVRFRVGGNVVQPRALRVGVQS